LHTYFGLLKIMMYMSKYNIWKKTIAIGMVCLFLANQLAWACPDNYTLAPEGGRDETYEELNDAMQREFDRRYNTHEGTEVEPRAQRRPAQDKFLEEHGKANRIFSLRNTEGEHSTQRGDIRRQIVRLLGSVERVDGRSLLQELETMDVVIDGKLEKGRGIKFQLCVKMDDWDFPFDPNNPTKAVRVHASGGRITFIVTPEELKSGKIEVEGIERDLDLVAAAHFTHDTHSRSTAGEERLAHITDPGQIDTELSRLETIRDEIQNHIIRTGELLPEHRDILASLDFKPLFSRVGRDYAAAPEDPSAEASYLDLLGYCMANEDSVLVLATEANNPLVVMMDGHSGSYNTWEIARLMKILSGPGILVQEDDHTDLIEIQKDPELLPRPETITQAFNARYDNGSFNIPAILYGLVDEIYHIVQPGSYHEGRVGTHEATLFEVAVRSEDGIIRIIDINDDPRMSLQEYVSMNHVHLLSKGDKRRPETWKFERAGLSDIRVIKKIKIHYITDPSQMPDLSKDPRPVLWSIDGDSYFQVDDYKLRQVQSRLRFSEECLRKINRVPEVFTLASSSDWTGEVHEDSRACHKQFLSGWVNIFRRRGINFICNAERVPICTLMQNCIQTTPSGPALLAQRVPLLKPKRKPDRGKGNYIEGLEAFLDVPEPITSRETAKTREELQDIRDFGKTTVLTELDGYRTLGLVKEIPAEKTPDRKPRYYLAEGVTREAVAVLREELSEELTRAKLEDPELRALLPRVRRIVPNNLEMRYIIGMCLLMRGNMKTPEAMGAVMELVATALTDTRSLSDVAHSLDTLFSDEYIGNWIAEYLDHRENNKATLDRRREQFSEFLKAKRGGREAIARLFIGPNAIANTVEAKAESGVLGRLALPFSEKDPAMVRAIYVGFGEVAFSTTTVCTTDERGQLHPLPGDQSGPMIILECDSSGIIRASCEDVKMQIHPNLREAINLHNRQRRTELTMRLSDREIRYLLAVGILAQRKYKEPEKIEESFLELLETDVPLKYALEKLGYTLTEKLIAACAVLYLRCIEPTSEEEPVWNRSVLERINNMLREAVRGSELAGEYSAVLAIFKPGKATASLHVGLTEQQREHEEKMVVLRRIRDRDIAGLSSPIATIADLLTPGDDQAQPRGPGRQDAWATLSLSDRPVPIGDPEPVHQRLIDGAIQYRHDENEVVALRYDNNDTELDFVTHLLYNYLIRSNQIDLANIFMDLLSSNPQKTYFEPHPDGYIPQITLLKTKDQPICRIPIEELGEEKRQELIAQGHITESDKVLEVYGHASDRGLSIAERFRSQRKIPATADNALLIFFELLRFMAVDPALTSEVWEYLYSESVGFENLLPEELSGRLREAVVQHLQPRRPGNLLKILEGRQAAMAKKPEPSPEARDDATACAPEPQLTGAGLAELELQYCITHPSEPELQLLFKSTDESKEQEGRVVILIDKIYDEKLRRVIELVEAVSAVMVERDPTFKDVALKQALDAHIRSGGVGSSISMDDLVYPVYLGISRSRKGKYDEEKLQLAQLLYKVMAQNGMFPVGQDPDAQIARRETPSPDQPRGPEDPTRETGYAALEDDPIPIGPARKVHEPVIDTAIRKAVEGEDTDVVKTVELGRQRGYEKEISNTMDFFDANRELSQLRKVVEDLMDEDENHRTLGEHPKGYQHRILIIDKEGEPICRVPVTELDEVGAKVRGKLGRKKIQIKGHASDRGPTVMDTKDPIETARIIIFEALRFMGVDKDTTNAVNAHLKKFKLTTKLPANLTKAVSEQVAARMRPERPGNLLASMGADRQTAMAKKLEPSLEASDDTATDEREFAEPIQRYGAGQLNAVFHFLKGALKHFPPDVIERIMQVVTWEDFSPDAISGRRSAIIRLTEPIIIHGKTIRAIKIKAVCYRPEEKGQAGLPQMQLYTGATTHQLPTEISYFDEHGNGKELGMPPRYQGVESRRNAMAECRETIRTFYDTGAASYVLGWGEYDENNFSGFEAGFVILGIEDENDNRLVLNVADRVGPLTGVSGEELMNNMNTAVAFPPHDAQLKASKVGSTMKKAFEDAFGVYGRELRRHHDSVRIHGQPHLENASLVSRFAFHDLGDNWTARSGLTPNRFLGYCLTDLMKAVYGIEVNSGPGHWLYNVAQCTDADLLRAFLNGYFHGQPAVATATMHSDLQELYIESRHTPIQHVDHPVVHALKAQVASCSFNIGGVRVETHALTVDEFFALSDVLVEYRRDIEDFAAAGVKTIVIGAADIPKPQGAHYKESRKVEFAISRPMAATPSKNCVAQLRKLLDTGIPNVLGTEEERARSFNDYRRSVRWLSQAFDDFEGQKQGGFPLCLLYCTLQYATSGSLTAVRLDEFLDFVDAMDIVDKVQFRKLAERTKGQSELVKAQAILEYGRADTVRYPDLSQGIVSAGQPIEELADRLLYLWSHLQLGRMRMLFDEGRTQEAAAFLNGITSYDTIRTALQDQVTSQVLQADGDPRPHFFYNAIMYAQVQNDAMRDQIFSRSGHERAVFEGLAGETDKIESFYKVKRLCTDGMNSQAVTELRKVFTATKNPQIFAGMLVSCLGIDGVVDLLATRETLDMLWFVVHHFRPLSLEGMDAHNESTRDDPRYAELRNAVATRLDPAELGREKDLSTLARHGVSTITVTVDDIDKPKATLEGPEDKRILTLTLAAQHNASPEKQLNLLLELSVERIAKKAPATEATPAESVMHEQRNAWANSFATSLGTEVDRLPEDAQLGLVIDESVANVGEYIDDFIAELEEVIRKKGWGKKVVIIRGTGRRLVEGVSVHLRRNKDNRIRGMVNVRSQRRYEIQFGGESIERIRLVAVNDESVPNTEEEDLRYIPLVQIIDAAFLQDSQAVPEYTKVDPGEEGSIITAIITLLPAGERPEPQELRSLFEEDAKFVGAA